MTCHLAKTEVAQSNLLILSKRLLPLLQYGAGTRAPRTTAEQAYEGAKNKLADRAAAMKF
jgi:hypothetical protein